MPALRDGDQESDLTPTIAFVSIFAVLCIFVSALAIVRIWRAEKYPNKALWILGCLLGFVGFSFNPATGNDLMMNIGVQIPVVYGLWSSPSSPPSRSRDRRRPLQRIITPTEAGTFTLLQRP